MTEPPAPDSTLALLYDQPYLFEFQAALRVLEQCLVADTAGLDALTAGRDIVRFRSHQSLSFPASDLWEVLPAQGEHPPTVIVQFMGMTGPLGALPLHYSQLVVQRLRSHRDSTLRDFLDLFNHRILSLFARAGQKYRFFLGYERAERIATELERSRPARANWFRICERDEFDRFSQILLDIQGLGAPPMRCHTVDRDALLPRLSVSDEVWRYYAGQLAPRQRGAFSLGELLSDFFQLPANVDSFQGQWLELAEDFQTSLGRDCWIPLGQGTIAGARVWDVQSKFRIRLGPLGYGDFRRFMPDTPGYRELVEFARLYARCELDFDLQLVLRRDEVPECELSLAEDAGVRLGYDAWLRNGPFDDDVADAVFAT